MGTRCTFAPDRLFSVMGEGWYVETRHGPVGPFTHRNQAERYLAALRAGSRWHRNDPWERCPLGRARSARPTPPEARSQRG
ncbi:MAG: hypothetical protein WCC36_04170 [Gammaproteobacteria bacterium]